MSQVTEQSVRFQTALASIKLIQASAVLDLTEDDFDFLTSNKRSEERFSRNAETISYAVFCLKKKSERGGEVCTDRARGRSDDARRGLLSAGNRHRRSQPDHARPQSAASSGLRWRCESVGACGG